MSSARSNAWTLVICAGLIALVAVIYGQAIDFEFVDFDDPEYVRDNEHVLGGFTLENVKWACTTTLMGNWNPLTWFSLMLDAELWGSDPAGFHRTNIMLHAVNVLLVFGGLLKLTGAMWRSALVSALFAVHPLHVESVAWVSERKDVLSSTFWLLTIWAWVWWVRKGGTWRYALTLIAFVLGLMSKTMLVTLPCALLLMDFWPMRRVRIGARGAIDPPAEPSADGAARTIGQVFVEKIPLFVVALVFCGVSMFAQGREGAMSHELTFGPRAANAMVSYTIHLRRLVWPSDLSIVHPHPALHDGPGWPAWRVALSIAMLGAITALALLLARRRPYAIVGWLWFVGTLVPVIGFVQIGYHGMADRYTYIPMLGMYTIIAWAAGDIAMSALWAKRIVPVAMALLVAGLAARAHVQTGYWQTSYTLFGRGLELRPDNWILHRHLAIVLKRDGRVEEALHHLHRALDRFPRSEGVMRLISDIHKARGEMAQAIDMLRRASEANPESAMLVNDVAALLYQAQRYDEAAELFTRAIAMDDSFAEPHNNLAVIAQRAGRPDVAEHHLRRAVQIDPESAKAWKNLGLVLMLQGRSDEAINALERAVDLGGDDGAEAQKHLLRLRAPAQTRPE